MPWNFFNAIPLSRIPAGAYPILPSTSVENTVVSAIVARQGNSGRPPCKRAAEARLKLQVRRLKPLCIFRRLPVFAASFVSSPTICSLSAQRAAISSGDESFPPAQNSCANLIRLKISFFNGLYCLITPDRIKNLFLISAVHPFTSLFCFRESSVPGWHILLLVCAARSPDSCFLILLQDPVCHPDPEYPHIIVAFVLCQTFFNGFLFPHPVPTRTNIKRLASPGIQKHLLS